MKRITKGVDAGSIAPSFDKTTAMKRGLKKARFYLSNHKIQHEVTIENEQFFIKQKEERIRSYKEVVEKSEDITQRSYANEQIKNERQGISDSWKNIYKAEQELSKIEKKKRELEIFVEKGISKQKTLDKIQLNPMEKGKQVIEDILEEQINKPAKSSNTTDDLSALEDINSIEDPAYEAKESNPRHVASLRSKQI